jgi:hypothetical protein
VEYKLTFKKYSAALKQDKLLGLKCKECGAINVPPKMACGKCGNTDMDIIELSGKGKIRTFTNVNVTSEGREGETPYTIVLVELDDGPWIMGNLIEIEQNKLTMDLIGRRVKMGHKVFPGDKYSAGDGARPLFIFES